LTDLTRALRASPFFERVLMSVEGERRRLFNGMAFEASINRLFSSCGFDWSNLLFVGS
uniref:Methyltransferase type 11 n=1 Tax=Haemonchus placei TaxID=6290 RepID=A0A0N4VYA9_HAEPC